MWPIYVYIVKIRDSALGLSGFVSFFGGRICGGGLIQGEFIATLMDLSY